MQIPTGERRANERFDRVDIKSNVQEPAILSSREEMDTSHFAMLGVIGTRPQINYPRRFGGRRRPGTVETQRVLHQPFEFACIQFQYISSL